MNSNGLVRCATGIFLVLRMLQKMVLFFWLGYNVKGDERQQVEGKSMQEAAADLTQPHRLNIVCLPNRVGPEARQHGREDQG